MSSVTQEWLSGLSWKMQTVLFSALRGCDGVSDNDPSKASSKFIRAAILQNAATKDSTFMAFDEDKLCAFVADIHAYPLHYVTHEMHALEIISFYHPNARVQTMARLVYHAIVDALHLRPETRDELQERLKDGVDSKNHKGAAEQLRAEMALLASEA